MLTYRTATSNREYIVAADTGNAVVGYAEFVLQSPTHAFLSYIGLDESVRQRGVGRRLIESYLEHHPAVTSIDLDVFADNINAMRFYTKLGFAEISNRRWLVRDVPMNVTPAVDAALPDIAHAIAAFERYGFCLMRASVGGRLFNVGRIGEGVLNFPDHDNYGDDRLVRSIASHFPSVRKVMTITECELGAEPLAVSRRLRWELPGRNTRKNVGHGT